jgi:hypothetical protein
MDDHVCVFCFLFFKSERLGVPNLLKELSLCCDMTGRALEDLVLAEDAAAEAAAEAETCAALEAARAKEWCAMKTQTPAEKQQENENEAEAEVDAANSVNVLLGRVRIFL